MGQYISKPLNNHSQTPNQPLCHHIQQQQNVTASSHISMNDLPTNVTVDILSRLPVKTIIHCKCVCKKWRILVSEAYFVKLHLSRSPPSLLFHHFTIQELHNFGHGILKLVDIEDEVHHHRLYHDPRMSFDLNRASFPKSVKRFRKLPIGSINGLVCLTESGNNSDNTYICNPITREYMMLPKHYFFSVCDAMSIVCGFGVGLVTGKYKVIRTLLTHLVTNPNRTTSRPDLLEAEVYTLGTGKWRSLGRVPYWLDERKKPFNSGPYLNGHVHWIIRDEDCPEKICTFDFDSETFKLFPSPPFDAKNVPKVTFQSLGVLNGCLSQCDSRNTDVTIWVMKEYGIKKSWHKLVNIRQSLCPKLLMFEPVALLEGFKDGGILMVNYDEKLFAYYPRTNTIEDIKMFNGHFAGITYRPSFVKLRDFVIESGRVRLLKV